ncbi:MAG: 50S ribosomal protein L4 [Candidatus Woesearchaeota archaeon]
MKVKILSTDGTEKGSIQMPDQFAEPVRKDVIKRAVTAIESNNRQPYGAKPGAGMRHSATLSRRRHDYRGSYGHGISRVPRKIMSRRGTRFNWVAAVAPGTVGGRRAHPPKADKIFSKKINAKENRLAIRSALSASMNKDLVAERGHKLPDNYPFALDDSFETLSKTKSLLEALVKIGLSLELERTQERKVRAGKGKARGRRFKTKTGPLIVTVAKSDLLKSVSNVSGFDIVAVENLNALQLAPGGVVGRLVLYTKSALEKMDSEKLFTEERVKKQDSKLNSKKKTKSKQKVEVSKINKNSSKASKPSLKTVADKIDANAKKEIKSE